MGDMIYKVNDVKVITQHAISTYGGVEVQLYHT
jgi:hypothetical protein